MKRKLAYHETIELHEILTFRNTCAAKSQSFIGIVTDDQLKAILQHDIETGSKHISDIKDLLEVNKTI